MNGKRVMKTIGSMAMILLFFVGAAWAEAPVWWNDQWQYRRQLQFDTSPAGADIETSLTDMPVLIRLHTGNFAFDKAKEDGEDIRFVAADGTTLLKHHTERYDTIDELAVIWVKLPKLAGGGGQDYIWMYYGNPVAAGGQAGRETYDGSQAMVYHFREIEGMPGDTTGNANNPGDFLGGLGMPGAIGNGVSFSGGMDKLVIPGSPTLNFSNGFTFSAWVQINQDQQDAYLFARESGGRQLMVGMDGAYLYASLTTAGGATVSTDRNAALTHGQWHHVAVTAAPDGQLVVYIDGTQTAAADVPGKPAGIEADVAIGGATAGGHGFFGEMDEVRVAGIARTADWVRAVYASEGPDGRLHTLGEEQIGEGSSGLPVFYIATILKNITLDGWVVIGLMALLSVASWLVFLSKTFFIYMIEKENKGFMKAYAEETSTDALLETGDAFENSSLFYIFKNGALKLSECLSNPSACRPGPGFSSTEAPAAPRGTLSARSLNAVKSVLEKGFIEQSKRLNSWLVVLTLAISGGPFLGLLGTVWGVMNTFAAMAEAGEANIMAIAPGIASALSTTVVGLIVAIPALFAYNYLTGKIKNIMADLTIFVDQFGVRIEELHGDRG